MNTAIYMTDGTLQIVLTPETDFEKDVLKKAKDLAPVASFYLGEFYECRGGWFRQSDYTTDKRSLMIRFDKPGPSIETVTVEEVPLA